MLKLLLGVIYAVITITAGIIAGYDWEQFKLLIVLIFNQFLLSFILYLRSNISGLHNFKIDSIISILDRFLMIIIVGVLLWTNIVKGKFKIEWFIFAQTSAYLTTATVAFFIVLKHAKFIKLRLNKPFLISTLRQTFPFAILVLLMSFYNRFDAVLLERLLPDGSTQAGIYAQSFRLLDAMSQFSLLFATLLLPIFSRMLKNKENVSELVQFSFFLIITPAVIFVASSIFYGDEIISLLYREHNEVSTKVFKILFLTFIPISSNYIFGTLLTANGSLKQLNIIAAIGVAVSLLLNLSLIPRLKAEGSAIAALSTQTFTALTQFALALYIFKIKFSLRKIASIIIFLVTFLTAAYFIHSYETEWTIAFVAILLVGIILAFLLRLISIKTIIRLLKGYEN